MIPKVRGPLIIETITGSTWTSFNILAINIIMFGQPIEEKKDRSK